MSVSGDSRLTTSQTGPHETYDLSDESTDEDDVPVALNRLVGPGTLSSKLSRESLYYKGSTCTSDKLMMYRRKRVEDESFLQDHQVNNILALNFIFHDEFLQDLRAIENSRWEYTLQQSDLNLIMYIAVMCATQEWAEALKQLFKVAHEHDASLSPIIMTAQNLMATTALWADKLLIRDNEDSFTERAAPRLEYRWTPSSLGSQPGRPGTQGQKKYEAALLNVDYPRRNPTNLKASATDIEGCSSRQGRRAKFVERNLFAVCRLCRFQLAELGNDEPSRLSGRQPSVIHLVVGWRGKVICHGGLARPKVAVAKCSKRIRRSFGNDAALSGEETPSPSLSQDTSNIDDTSIW
ncbi:hypothetical protein DFQ26_004475 [Actinomortierella ambigua]|nr:hypothetical protein DFQ26_004475 [Actinomortierella ambigua]